MIEVVWSGTGLWNVDECGVGLVGGDMGDPGGGCAPAGGEDAVPSHRSPYWRGKMGWGIDFGKMSPILRESDCGGA